MVRSFYALALGAVLSFLPSRQPGSIDHSGQIGSSGSADAGQPFTNNAFAFRLLHTVLEQDTGHHNMLISPLSVYLSMSILYNGAAHDTKDSIAGALESADIDITRLNVLSKDLLQHLPLEDEKVQIAFTNSIWCNRRKFTPLPSFEDISQNYYYAPVQSVNFSVPAAAVDINRWVSRNTHNMIPAIIDRTWPADWMYLIDAVCFIGDWQQPFGEPDTHNDLFHLASGAVEKLPFLQKDMKTRVFEDTSFTMVELPYGNGQGFGMYILMPDDPQTPIRDFAATFDADRLNKSLALMTVRSIQLSVPAWEYAYSIDDLRPALTHLGMGIAFDKDLADFSNLFADRRTKAAVSKVIHKTYIKVSEKGTRAAAVTDPGPVTPGVDTRRRLIHQIVADHPFLYLIEEKQRNLLLFAGVVEDPAKN